MNKTTLTLGLALAGFTATQAQLFHLGIDLSNPSSVVITATAQPALANTANTSLFDGATLLDFFTAPISPSAGGPLNGSIRPYSASLAYDGWTSDSVGSLDMDDLNLYTEGNFGNNPQIFGTFFQAFISSGSLDLSAFSAELPALGAKGDILSGYSGNFGPIVGQWEITAVPELPVAAHLALYGAGFAGLAIYRRTRKS
jgi:hypothetical protein